MLHTKPFQLRKLKSQEFCEIKRRGAICIEKKIRETNQTDARGLIALSRRRLNGLKASHCGVLQRAE